MSKQGKCTCWRIPDEDGRVLPNAWVAMHRHIRVVCGDGHTASGYSDGASWWGSPDGPMVVLLVEPEDGEAVGFERHEVATVTPLDGYASFEAFQDAVLTALDRHRAASDPEEFALHIPVDDHSELEVTIQKHTHRCAPPSTDPAGWVEPTWDLIAPDGAASTAFYRPAQTE